MSMKHVFKSSHGLVDKSLRGFAGLNPTVRLHTPSKTVYISQQSPSARVAVVSGGGAGHEPAHASYTGRGMLAASVSGDIFASPSVSQVLTALHLAAFGAGPHIPTQPKDLLVIINNYTGDRLNFGLAMEKFHVLHPTVRVESVVVADDVSLLAQPTLVGPRGLAGNILVCKVLGALAERGSDLRTLKVFGDAIVANLRSIGVGLDHCHVPGRAATPSLNAQDRDQCELGLGLHNEPGVLKMSLESAEDLIEKMLTHILSSYQPNPLPESVILFLNNLGGISQLEMGAILDEVLVQLGSRKLSVSRAYCSSYMTSLNAPGFSVSILDESAIEKTGAGTIDMPTLLDDPTNAIGWTGFVDRFSANDDLSVKAEAYDVDLFISSFLRSTDPIPGSQQHSSRHWRTMDLSPLAVDAGIEEACNALLRVEADLTKYDSIVGDGDCGETFSRGARAVLNGIQSGRIQSSNVTPELLVSQIADLLEESMGGTIGALFAIYLNAFAAALKAEPRVSYAEAVRSALNSLRMHTPAQPGDRTVMDALVPFTDALTRGRSLHDAAEDALLGASSTARMMAKFGRATYITTESTQLPPDPGACGVSEILRGFARGYHSPRSSTSTAS